MLVSAAIVTALIAAGTVYQMYILLWRPELTEVPERKWPLWKTAMVYVSMFAGFIGVGYMIYKGAEAALWFIPRSWTVLNEDGEPEWVAHVIASFIALFGSLAFFSRLIEIASEKAREFWSRPPSQRG